MMTNKRLERVRNRLRSSPLLAEAAREAIATGRCRAAAPEITDVAADAAAADRQPLESVVPTNVLEAIVQRIGRPPLLIRNDTVQVEPLVDFPPVLMH
jgi:endonuclease G, mitochondrial